MAGDAVDRQLHIFAPSCLMSIFVIHLPLVPLTIPEDLQDDVQQIQQIGASRILDQSLNPLLYDLGGRRLLMCSIRQNLINENSITPRKMPRQTD